MSDDVSWRRRLKDALACEECRRRRRAALIVVALIALVWIAEQLSLP